MQANGSCNSWKQKCDQERSGEDFKNIKTSIEIQRMWNVRAKVISAGANLGLGRLGSCLGR